MLCSTATIFFALAIKFEKSVAFFMGKECFFIVFDWYRGIRQTFNHGNFTVEVVETV